MKYFLSALLVLVFLGDTVQSQTSKLKAYSNIKSKFSKETSGIVKSRVQDNVFWVLDDSGNDDRIYAIKRNGKAAFGKDDNGQELKGAKNKDWEDIMVDDQGNVIIADIGNNCNCRDDLAFHFVEEVTKSENKVEVIKTVKFTYPPVESVLNVFEKANYDAEASFYFDGALYILTKHHFISRKTKLFKVEISEDEKSEVVAELMGEFKIDGSVTAADMSADGNKLAILTYTSVWVFEINGNLDLNQAKASRKSIKADQVESVTFDGADLIIVDEAKGKMYAIPVSELEEVDY